MSVSENKAVVRRFHEEFTNRGDLSVADEVAAPACVLHYGGRPPAAGPDSFKRTLTMLRTAFPDLTYTIEDMVAEGDEVAERVTVRGTHRGEFLGVPPTNRPVTFSGLVIFRFAGGRIVENWAMPDLLSVLQQLGAVPGPDQPSER
jgi:steroid delta-isomerase-like uncharacterized protein